MNELAIKETVDVQEQESLGRMSDAIMKAANELVVCDEASNAAAGDVLKQVKRLQNQVKNFWEPLRVAAKASMDAVLSRKKEMMTPLETAEKTLKAKVADYTMELARKRAEEERLMREAAKREMERKLEEAAAAETAGDAVSAEFAMSEAEVMEGVAMTAKVENAAPKVAGVSQRKAWKITVIDQEKVPVIFNGVVIRPVDEKAIAQMIKSSKGTVQIPGVTYEETVCVSVRA